MISLPTLASILSMETEALVFITLSSVTVLSMIVATYLLFGKSKVALDSTKFVGFKLIEKNILSHDSALFKFELQTPETRLGLPIGQHISFEFKDSDGRNHQRSYTPVTGDETVGTVSFVIKIYRANVHPRFPKGGKMSQHLDTLKVGDFLNMKGPKGHLEYFGRGKFSVKQMRKPVQVRQAKHFAMLAGGTGITPMLQVIQAIFRDDKDVTTTIGLVYANQTEDDILCRDELEAICKKHPDRFQLHYTLDRPTTTAWEGSTGFVNQDMVESHALSKKTTRIDTQVLMCGPPAMIKFACLPSLKEAGFDEGNWFMF